ncbi:hypothetical protein HG531_005044 [Fusarium graminearum]|nr:hypothetical protein HG531_005044 [Fusarium graminearum]
MSTRRTNAIEVRESIEAKTAGTDVEMKNTMDNDIDAEGDPDVDMDAEGDEDAEGEVDDEGRPDMYRLIHNLSTYLCSVEDDGEQLAAGFQRIPNRRTLPDYFEIISEPIAFSTIRGKTQKKQYSSFAEFVKDVAQICHNAQVYNRPSAPIFGAAVRLREILVRELQKLVEKGHITTSDTQLPDLDQDKDYEDDSHKRRGRPPSVLTPNEARITSILKGLRKPRDAEGHLLVHPFERLPDKAAVPDYYTTIQNPIALDNIKKKVKRKKYQSVDQVLQDLNLMFENAKRYNEDDSEVYKAAVDLQREAHMLAEQEKAKPDDDFRDEDGKLPLAEIQYHGQSWKVGDWIHIRNPNDLAKPTVAQIYRTWQDRAGQRWINACWYYRPEQTVHRYDKYFYEYEVVKTGQYRDHQIEDVLDRCFVMFVTRFNKGRPRGFPLGKEIYVCESRYNEEKFTFNKIKTWASCVPDEVRDKDYEMDLYDVPRRMKKIPSPIKHLLREDAKETDELPKPTWGSPNAPPIVGAVHRRPREINESPPPEPTPPPQAMSVVPLSDVGTDAGRRASVLPVPGAMPGDHSARHPSISYPGGPSPSPVPYNAHMTPHFQPATPGAQPPQVHQTPVPIPHPPHLGPQPQVSVRPVQYQPQPQHQQAGYAQGFVPNYGQPAPPMHQQTPMGTHITQAYNQAPAPPVARSPMAPTPGMPVQSGNAYNPPRPPEVYALPDNMNDALPRELRQTFQHDSAGRVLFFTAPPLERSHKGISHESAGLGHSVKYLAGRKEWLAEREKKRKERDEKTGDISQKRFENDVVGAHEAGKAIVAQASDAMAMWLEKYDSDTQRWTDQTGLEGWREVTKANKEKRAA